MWIILANWNFVHFRRQGKTTDLSRACRMKQYKIKCWNTLLQICRGTRVARTHTHLLVRHVSANVVFKMWLRSCYTVDAACCLCCMRLLFMLLIRCELKGLAAKAINLIVDCRLSLLVVVLCYFIVECYTETHIHMSESHVFAVHFMWSLVFLFL